MWKTDKFTPPQPDRANGFSEDVHVGNDEASSAMRTNSATLDDLRAQPGFGVVVSAAEIQAQPPAANGVPSIGQRMSAELDILSRRDRQIREMKDLATHRVVDLTTEQLRRILEFMV